MSDGSPHVYDQTHDEFTSLKLQGLRSEHGAHGKDAAYVYCSKA